MNGGTYRNSAENCFVHVRAIGAQPGAEVDDWSVAEIERHLTIRAAGRPRPSRSLALRFNATRDTQ